MAGMSHLEKNVILLLDGLTFSIIELREVGKVHIVIVVQALKLLTLRFICIRVECRTGPRRQGSLSTVEEGSQCEPGGVPNEVCTRKEPT